MASPVGYMARNGVAANLLMVFILAAGMFASQALVQEVFPEFSLDTIQVNVPYPGANPEEIEESIVQKIEEQIEAVEGIKEIRGTAYEGRGVVVAELDRGTDAGRALDDIKAQVDRISTFPAQAERPEVTELTNRQSAIKLAVFGDVDERALKETAYRLEDQLSALPEVSYVDTSAVRNYEISIEVSRETLRALDLDLPDLARRVRAGSVELSAGSVETPEEEVRVRTLGQNYNQQDFENVTVISQTDGSRVTLGEIANVDDGFEDSDLLSRYNGQPMAFVEVFRSSDERVLEIVDAVRGELENFRASLPAGIKVEIWNNEADNLEDRVALLVKNASIGLALVLAALTLFLNLRLAFWTAVGIAVSFVGTFAVMLLADASINQISLFAFILAIGIVVDDAIVVGENIFAEREKGHGPMEAAVRGARRITGPVIFAVLSTIVAFTPLFFVPGPLGKILGAIPIVAISVLALSLIESLLILPHHLSSLPENPDDDKLFAPVARLQKRVDRQLQRFVDGPLDRILRFAIRVPSIIIASAIALILVSIALIPAGIITVSFFPAIEGDVVTANLKMPVGSSVERTDAVIRSLEQAGYRVMEQLERERSDDKPDLVQAVYVAVGQQTTEGGPGGETTARGSNLGAVQFKLLEGEKREISALRFEEIWREEVGPVPLAESLTFVSEIVGLGPSVQVEISHPEIDKLQRIEERVLDRLAQINGVYDLASDLDLGTKEIRLGLKPAARTLGLTVDDLARQTRAAFFGEEALRVQRGREEVRVYVRLPESQRDSIGSIADFWVRIPSGGQVPLDQVADIDLGEAPAVIKRKDGRRVLTITGEVEPSIVTSNEVAAELSQRILPDVERDFPDMSFSFGGEQEEQAESFAALGTGFVLALIVIYALLAIPFRSYIQPLIIMAAIPFGVIGALIGHLIMDLSLGILSIFGIIGLSGVVVNDSLVMIDFINERVREGKPANQAILEGAKARFRPILLTSLTTSLSVAPLVLERSLQAQFLIPMAASIGFGIIFATAILMLVVPALSAVQLRWLGRAGRIRERESALGSA